MAPGEEEPPQQSSMTESARAKLNQLQQGVWSSLRSINVDDEHQGDSKRSVLAQWAPRSSSEEEGGTLESMVRTMFGSCTAFDVQDDDEQSASASSKRRSRRSSSSPSAQAKQAVNNLREKAEQRETSPSNRVSGVSRPFPVSSPSRKVNASAKNEVPYLVHEAPPPPPNGKELGATATFDDGISAISAHTLEELDRQHMLTNAHKFKAVHSDLTHEVDANPPVQNTVSKESSLFPSSAPSDTEERDCIGEPISFSRGRSNQTWGSKKTFQSQSTASTNFEEVWRQEEHKYWQETVEKDEKKGVRKGSLRDIQMMMNARSNMQDGPLKETSTNTTAGSSNLTGMSSQHVHPHDTLPFDASDLIPISIRSPRRISRDPDRIQEFIVVDALTEIGEI